MSLKQIIFIVGPTAVGKSEVALKLAEELDGEIISCDSMQIYKELNIISCKPSKEMLAATPHHLIDVISIEEKFDVAKYATLVENAINEILKKEKYPIIVGGSGLYMQVILDGVFKDKVENKNLREELLTRSEKEGNEVLHQELEKLDSVAAQKIHVNDTRRITRALEVCLATEKPFSKVRMKRDGLWDKYDFKLFCLNRDRDVLYDRINKRVDAMFEEGVVDEIRNVLGLNLSRTGQVLIGVREIKKMLDGECSEEEAKDQIKKSTRHFAKRQLTWFRGEERLTWVDIKESDSLNDIVKKIESKI